MNKLYSINYLSNDFFNTMCTPERSEIENKPERPYVVLLVNISGNTFAIPFRTNLPHNNGYKFRKTGRPTKCSSGIDFSKAVIVNDKSYIGNTAFVDKEEFRELSNKSNFIIKKFETYVNNYIKVANGTTTDKYTVNKYQYSTLRYFHDELGIKEESDTNFINDDTTDTIKI